MKQITTVITILLMLFTIQACGESDAPADRDRPAAATQEEGLSEFELEHGIGPVTERIDIGEGFNNDKVEQGRNIYEMKCEMCHNYEGRMVGPELGNVLERRSPEFVMNFILNPSGMVREHPVGQEMLREYMTIMPFQNVKEDEARAIVEYLRYYAEHN
jgi:cytochrome c2